MVGTSLDSFPGGRIRLSRRMSVDGIGERIDGLFVGRPPFYLWQEGADEAPNLQMWLAEDCLVLLDIDRTQCRIRIGGASADYGREFASIVQGPGSALLDEAPERVRRRAVKAGIRYRHRDPRAYVRTATFDQDSLPVDVETSDLRVTWKRADLPDLDVPPRMPDFRTWRLEVYEHEMQWDSRLVETAGRDRPDEAFLYRSGAMTRPQLHAIWGEGSERVRMSLGVPVERGHLAREAVRVSAVGGVDRPVIVTRTAIRAEAVADRISWLTNAQPRTIWPTLIAEAERPESIDAWKAGVFDRVLAKIDPNRLASG